MGPGAIERIISFETIPPTLTPMNTSLPRITSSSVPLSLSRLVSRAIRSLAGFMCLARPR